MRAATLVHRSALAITLAVLAPSCGRQAETDENDAVETLGSIEVTAKLVDVPGEFVNRPLYDYAFVMKYEVLAVHRGDVDGNTLYIGHYNPLEPRASVADARVPEVGGNLSKFRAGDVHRMALEVPIDDHYMGGIINRYFGKEQTGPIYWAVWTDRSTD